MSCHHSNALLSQCFLSFFEFVLREVCLTQKKKENLFLYINKPHWVISILYALWRTFSMFFVLFWIYAKKSLFVSKKEKCSRNFIFLFEHATLHLTSISYAFLKIHLNDFFFFWICAKWSLSNSKEVGKMFKKI